jgi:cytoskeletal protein CcmA (bactofilin family)
MDSAPSPGSNTPSTPEAEELKPRADAAVQMSEDTSSTSQQGTDAQQPGKHPHHRLYRPSHKATFIGLFVVIAILAINVGVFVFVLNNQSKANSLGTDGKVTISPSALEKLGVKTAPLNNSGYELTVGPNAQFKGTVKVAGDTSLNGKLNVNSKISGTDASLTQLEAGNTSLGQLNVNGDGTLSNLNLRQNLVVTGTTRLQGVVSVSNSVDISGNLAVGGTFSAGAFSARSLTSTGALTVDGHVVTGGATPNVGPGSALGSNGTVSISGNDAAGTVAINIGVGAAGGILANVAFKTQYGNVPRIIITPVGVAGNFYISKPSVAGFSIDVGSGLPPGGYSVNYIVEQ